MTNADFAREDKNLAQACRQAGIPVSKRQASKWRMGKGIAYKTAKLRR